MEIKYKTRFDSSRLVIIISLLRFLSWVAKNQFKKKINKVTRRKKKSRKERLKGKKKLVLFFIIIKGSDTHDTRQKGKDKEKKTLFN